MHRLPKAHPPFARHREPSRLRSIARTSGYVENAQHRQADVALEAAPRRPCGTWPRTPRARRGGARAGRSATPSRCSTRCAVPHELLPLAPAESLLLLVLIALLLVLLRAEDIDTRACADSARTRPREAAGVRGGHVRRRERASMNDILKVLWAASGENAHEKGGTRRARGVRCARRARRRTDTRRN